jgi:phospholipid/cholesterol/gamma-HCH transport system substrate-binding protein
MNRGIVAGLAVLALTIVGYLVLSAEDDRYLVKLELENAGGLRNGANVRIGGAPAGRVTNVRISKDDLALADLRLDKSVTPIGKGATAIVDTDGIFGERFVQIERGDLDSPQPDGSTIDAKHSSVSVRLDDVVDALEPDTREALQIFLSEQGQAIVGRGEDLAQVLTMIPPSLDSTRELLAQFALDNQALGRLVESSDRVVAEVAGEREQLGRLLAGFGETLDLLDSRRNDLGETFRRAPETLQVARRALVELQDAVVPLVPAAQGLQASAPALTSTLQELPRFTAQALPLLNTAERVAPDLQRLGDGATPTVRKLAPMARELSEYTRVAFGPFTQLLDDVDQDLFGLMEGWARSTQGRDEASHVFRFGATTGSDTLAVLLSPAAKKPGRAPGAKKPSAPDETAAAPQPASGPTQLPGVEVPSLDALLPGVLGQVDKLVKKPPLETVNGLLDRLNRAPKSGEPLLDYLLGP